MSRDLERLIESLITDVSCYGDLGCTVSHVLEALDAFYQDAHLRSDKLSQADPSASTRTNQLLWSTAWDWLRIRKDLSVGANRKWNHLPLSDILTIPDADAQDGIALKSPSASIGSGDVASTNEAQPQPGAVPPRKDLPRKRPRIYVSEDRMWESIAGHAPDYRRVPRLEWMALVGIASTKQQGILQGDLGRLVGQDKRSLPKRTDALAEKGYISKRTTLVRGTKTSKLWLTRFAPALPTDPTKVAAGMPANVDMSREALASDLEPVSWRGRWTGDSVDYISLAQTIMAVVKAYRIIRYHDLRCKLGILGLRWQMKVAAKTCRFFVRTGAIQYVGATLSGKLFKDCLKFDHDLTHEDWAAYLATGKQKSPSFSSSGFDAEIFPADGMNAQGPTLDTASRPVLGPQRSKKTRAAPWVADKPLTTTVFDNIQAAGPAGLSNKQIGDTTLGPSFRRYLSSISSTLAIPVLQPNHLKHFQVLSEMHRKGKSQQYRYFAPQLAGPPEPSSAEAVGDNDNGVKDAVYRGDSHAESIGLFVAPSIPPDTVRAVGGLTALAQGPGKGATVSGSKRKAEVLDISHASEPRDLGSRRGKRARLASLAYQEGLDEEHNVPPATSHDSNPESSLRMSTRGSTGRRKAVSTELDSMIVKLKVRPKALSDVMRALAGGAKGENRVDPAPAETGFEDKVEARSSQRSDAGSRLESRHDASGCLKSAEDNVAPDDTQESIVVAHEDQDRNAEENPLQLVNEAAAEEITRRGGRRGKKKGAEKKTRSVFKCEKCGGTWKNDVGMKYHLEKSKTTCNPNYVPPATAPPELVDRISISAKLATPRQTRLGQVTTPAIDEADEIVPSPTGGLTLGAAAPDAAAAGLDDLNNMDILVSDGNTATRRRNTRTSRPRWSHASSEARFGVRNRIGGQRQPCKSSSLRPPISAVRSSMSGLIDDTDGTVRDMPAEHAPIQPSFKRLRVEETTTTSAADHRGSPSTSFVEAGEAFLPTCAQERGSGGQTNSKSNTSGAETSSSVTLGLSNAEAVRNSIGIKGALVVSGQDLMEKILMHILHANGGVFPGGCSVWYAVLATWEVAFPGEPTPAHQSYKDALARLAKRKQIVVSTHAFKDSRGMMGNYQLLRVPGVEASSPAGAAMKAKITAAHPKAYTPLAFTPKTRLHDEDSNDVQPVFSSRRRLVQGIEVLDAPFYAKKAANERPVTPPEGTNLTPRKRKRRMVTKEQITHAEDDGPDGTRRRDIFRFFMDGNDGAHNGLTRSSSMEAGRSGFVTPLVFLKPNTYLGQDVPEEVRHSLLPPDGPTSEPTYPSAPAKDAVANNFSVSFTGATVIVGRRGVWPATDDSLFDVEDCSLTILGWMPDSRWFLKQNLPQNFAEMVKWRGRPRAKFPSSSHYQEFSEQVDACFDWELSTEGMKLMLAESIVPEHIFINLGVSDLPGKWENPPLDWNSANQLSASLLFDVRLSDFTTTAADHLWGGDLGRQRRRKRRQKQPITDTKDLVVGIDLKIRSLITLPKDADLREASKRNNGLDETNEIILIAAFVVTRTLLGGADRVIEWGLMMTLFPDMALSAMRRFWSKARKDRRTFISQLTERFQIRFIPAYENNEFPAIDFDNYVNYDWVRLIRWTAGLIEDSVELPASKNALVQGYSLAPAWADIDNWREDYYNFQMSVFNRFEAATSRPATSLIDEGSGSAPNTKAKDLVTAMSWLRSLCYTPRDRYAPQDIRRKMASIGGGDQERIQNLLEQAVETLQGQGIITDSKLKALEGRPYRLTETFLPRLIKWTHQHKFVDAARFKSRLDVSFRRGEKIRIPYVLRDGEVMAMMNLQANGRVAVTTVDVPSIPLGFDPGNYESRKYPKSYYNFGLEIAPTQDYLYDDDLEVIERARSNRPPRENQNRAIPLWSDFFGELNIERWSQVLGAVAFVIATRGPLDVPSVGTVLKPYLQEFEVEMVFDWGRQNGVLKHMAHGTSCTVDEWWWLLVGRQRGIAL
ncbi:hypothetical protein GQ607_001381 [Colletotrichum asianum]|uniref:Tfiiic transcription initiation factor complex subunits tfc3 n=1 Tax=Colletotrichum asianum TaxID=702518 RepID=A0A8H3WSH5_9PEZI|nr:hypothetical protein GQ607_001381 [Colletotrichum asianum]